MPPIVVFLLCLLCLYIGARGARVPSSRRHAHGAKLDQALKHQLISGSLGNTRRPPPESGLGVVDAVPSPLQRPTSEVPAPGLYVVKGGEP